MWKGLACVSHLRNIWLGTKNVSSIPYAILISVCCVQTGGNTLDQLMLVVISVRTCACARCTHDGLRTMWVIIAGPYCDNNVSINVESPVFLLF